MSDDNKNSDKKDNVVTFRSIMKVAEEAKQDSKSRGLRKAADDVIDGLPLFVSSDFDEHTPMYLRSENNVAAIFKDKLLEVRISEMFPNYIDRDRKEVMKFVKLKLLREAPIDFTTIQPVAFADEMDKLTWNRLKFKKSDLADIKLEDNNLKEFAHFLSLCDDPDALVIWIGSLLDPQAGRTQYLHLYGSGGNGKSVLFDAIGDVLGTQHVVSTRADEFMNQHWGSQVEGARILLFPDENNPGFFSTGKFKEFTGEHAASVNPKYEKPRRIRLTHKTAVFSNNRVEISTNAADRRRLLSISLQDDPDPNVGFKWWYQGLRNAGPQILAYCYHFYTRKLQEHPAIRAFIPQADATIEAAINRKYAEIFDIIHEKFEVTGKEEHFIPRTRVHGEIIADLKDRRGNRVLNQNVREALLKAGAKEGTKHGKQAVYIGIKEASLKLPKGV